MFKFAPDTLVPERPDDLAGHKHRRLLGHIGLWFPFIIIGIVWMRDGWDVFLRLDSVSAYYYSGAVSAFSGMLVAFSFFLFTYDGYKDPKTNEPCKADRVCAITAASAALLVALFPTSEPMGFTRPPWLEAWMVGLHLLSAFVLFSAFAYFCLRLFPIKAKTDTDEERKQKNWRNAVYYGCGGLILVCLLFAFYYKMNKQPIFWAEAFALIFFSISWLVKGYAHTHAYQWLVTHLATSADDEKPADR